MELKDIWQATLGELEVVLSKASFTTWVKDTRLVSIESETALIGVPSIFTQEWLEKKYHKDIIKTLNKLTGGQVNLVKYQIGNQAQTAPQIKLEERRETPKEKEEEPAKPVSSLRLRDNNNFDSFVVGPNNRLAYAASVAVSKNPGKSHNPLVIYGGVGLGKTHLMQAIGNTIAKEHPKLTIMYTSCEDFANDFVSSIQSKKADSFKKKYRSIDVFLVDDIQFLSRKEGTQEEFFHTFNTLHQNNRQIVMTSDRIPTAIPHLEDRLSSRFSWGMVADIQPPNLETRQAILREKAANSQLQIDPRVLDMIAENFQSNIRELEGALNRVLAYCSLHDKPVSLDLARQALKEFIGQSSSTRKINPDNLIDIVAKYYGIPRDELIGPKRYQELIKPRQLTMFLLKNELHLSYPKVGQAMNGRDHTTVMHGVSVIERELGRNSDLREEIALIRKELYTE